MSTYLMRVRDIDGNTLDPVSEFISLKFTAEINTLASLEFEVHKDAVGAAGIVAENYVTLPIYDGNEYSRDFVIKDVKLTGNDVYSAYAIQNVEALKNTPFPFYDVPGTIAAFARKLTDAMNETWVFLLAEDAEGGTAWQTTKCAIEQNTTVWGALTSLVEQVNAHFVINQMANATTKTVTIYPQDTWTHYDTVHLFESVNLKQFEKESTADDVITKICPIGKDGLLLDGTTQRRMNVPSENNWLTDTTYFEKVVPAWVEFGDVETTAELRTVAEAYLQTVNRPKTTYAVSLLDLKSWKQDASDVWPILNLETPVAFFDTTIRKEVSARIVKVVFDLLNADNNTFELSTVQGSFIASAADERRKLADTAELASQAYAAAKKGSGADYVIDEGTSGAWTYRKWSSGTVEAWASFTTSKANYTTVNSWYARYDDFTIPSGIFTDFSTQAAMPTIIANVNVGTGITIASNINCIAANTIRVFSLENQSGTQTCNYKIYAIGK